MRDATGCMGRMRSRTREKTGGSVLFSDVAAVGVRRRGLSVSQSIVSWTARSERPARGQANGQSKTSSDGIITTTTVAPCSNNKVLARDKLALAQ